MKVRIQLLNKTLIGCRSCARGDYRIYSLSLAEVCQRCCNGFGSSEVQALVMCHG